MLHFYLSQIKFESQPGALLDKLSRAVSKVKTLSSATCGSSSSKWLAPRYRPDVLKTAFLDELENTHQPVSSSTRINAWFNIRPGEERPTALMLLHSFFMGISTVFFETAASALFLAQFDASALPVVYLAAAVVSILTGLTYTRLKDRVGFATLMIGTLGSLLVLVCLTRLGLSAFEAGWLIFKERSK